MPKIFWTFGIIQEPTKVYLYCNFFPKKEILIFIVLIWKKWQDPEVSLKRKISYKLSCKKTVRKTWANFVKGCTKVQNISPISQSWLLFLSWLFQQIHYLDLQFKCLVYYSSRRIGIHEYFHYTTCNKINSWNLFYI